MTNRPQRILIAGGGIAGLTAAIALRQAHFEVDIVEIMPQWSASGIGISLVGNALRALDTIGLAGNCIDAGYSINASYFFNEKGDLLGKLPQAKVAGPQYPGSCALTRPRLQTILIQEVSASGAHIQLGLSVTAIEQTEAQALVTFSNGTRASYDLVIGADGYRSTIRTLVFGPEYQPVYSGQVCWRCNVPRLPEVNGIWLFNGQEFKAGFIPLAPDLMYILLTDTPPAGPPPRYKQEQLVEAFRERLAEFSGLVAQVRDHMLNASSNVVYRPFEVLFMPKPWHRGRVVLIGDAVHTMTPHIIQGGAMAIEDAIVLAEELATTQTSLPETLHRFTERRYERSKTMFDISLQIGKWEQDHDPNTNPIGLTGKSVEIANAPI